MIYFTCHTYFMATLWKGCMFIGLVWRHKHWFCYGVSIIYMCSQIPLCGCQHHSTKGFHAPCWNVVGLIHKIITRHRFTCIFGGLASWHYIIGGTRFGWCWANGYGDSYMAILRPFSNRHKWWFASPTIKMFLGDFTSVVTFTTHSRRTIHLPFGKCSSIGWFMPTSFGGIATSPCLFG